MLLSIRRVVIAAAVVAMAGLMLPGKASASSTADTIANAVTPSFNGSVWTYSWTVTWANNNATDFRISAGSGTVVLTAASGGGSWTPQPLGGTAPNQVAIWTGSNSGGAPPTVFGYTSTEGPFATATFGSTVTAPHWQTFDLVAGDRTGSGSIATVAAPEPSTVLLFSCGLLLALGAASRLRMSPGNT